MVRRHGHEIFKVAVNVCAGNNGITLRMAALEAQTPATESEAIEIFYCCTNIYKILTSRRYWCNVSDPF